MARYGSGMGKPHIRRNFAPVASNVAKKSKRPRFRLKRPRINVKNVPNFGFGG